MSIFDERMYSPRQIAKFCGISDTTVTRWIDTGLLKKIDSPSKHRKVAQRDLIEFLQSRNYPIPKELKQFVEAFVLFKDGSDWCCVRPSFVNLQESLAGFGGSLYEAQQDLLRMESEVKG